MFVYFLDWQRLLPCSSNFHLSDACLEGEFEEVKKCIESGVDVRMTNEEGLTPLHSSSCNGHGNIVKYLLEHGADVNAVDISLILRD